MLSIKNSLATLASFLIFGCVLPITSSAQTAGEQSGSGSNHSTLSASDQRFMKEAAQGSAAEVELGQLAREKAESPDIKAFAQRMVEDHTKANDQLKQVAGQKGVPLPPQPDAKDSAEKTRLGKMSGAQFDKAYMNYMVADHKKDVAALEKEASHASDPDLRNFAQATLPTLQSHLQQAESIAPKQNAAAARASTTASNSKPQ
jgi:putative membrane protein